MSKEKTSIVVQPTASPIWIVDDNKHFSLRLKTFLQSHKFQNVSIFYSCESALECIANHISQPDVILLDIQFSPNKMSGFDFLKNMRTSCVAPKILVMTLFNGDEYVRFTLKHGAVGFINKSQSPNDVLRAIHIALQGGIYADASTLSRMIPFSTPDMMYNENYNLTIREKDVLSLLADGLPIKTISTKICVSPNTIKYHIKLIHKKLNVKSRGELVAKLLKEKIL